eukprot:g44398.t1
MHETTTPETMEELGYKRIKKSTSPNYTRLTRRSHSPSHSHRHPKAHDPSAHYRQRNQGQLHHPSRQEKHDPAF